MSSVTLTINTAAARALTARAVRAGLLAAADVYAQALRKALDLEGPPPSSPGEPPRRDRHQAQDAGRPMLADDIQIQEDGPLKVGVGTNFPRVSELELGTSSREARPVWERTANEQQQAMQAACHKAAQQAML